MRNEDATEAAPTAGVGPPEVPIGYPEGRRVHKLRGCSGDIEAESAGHHCAAVGAVTWVGRPMSMAIAIGNLGGPSAHGGYGDNAARRRRVELREFGSLLSNHGELAGCGRTISKGRVGSATEFLEVTTSCRRKWLCPTCGYTASWREAAKLKRRLLGWTAQGCAVALLTLTQSHCPEDGLAMLWSRLEAGWAALVRGSGWTADKRAHGVRGYVRVTELVHNAAAGWNVHFHVILLLDRSSPWCGDGLGR